MALSVVHWAGGKGRQLDYLLPLIPITRIYCEPFGGGGSVLLNRPLSEIEVYNDLDGELVNLFTVIQDDASYRDFRRRVAFTPYSRDVFTVALASVRAGIELDAVKRAVAFYTVLNQSVSGKRLASVGDWSRNRTVNNADNWFRRQEGLVAVHERVKNVQLENRDALDIIRQWDTPDTTFYLDPPYILETRGRNRYYAVEPGDDFHRQLVEVLLAVKGAVVLSGYDHDIYKHLAGEGWYTDSYGQTTTMDVNESLRGGVKGRVEVVYRNRRAADYAMRRPLFLSVPADEPYEENVDGDDPH